MSEGLAKSIEIDGERWTYSAERDGYRFSCPRGRMSVFVAGESERCEMFSAGELTAFLQNHTAHERINQIVVIIG